MIKKITAIFIAALMLVCILSACSGKGTDSKDEICGKWNKQGDNETECIYVINADGTGHIEENNVKFELTWKIDENNNYTFDVDATSAYESMFEMSIEEIIAANLIDESSLHRTESGTYAFNNAFLVLIHDGTTEYFRRVEE